MGRQAGRRHGTAGSDGGWKCRQQAAAHEEPKAAAAAAGRREPAGASGLASGPPRVAWRPTSHIFLYLETWACLEPSHPRSRMMGLGSCRWYRYMDACANVNDSGGGRRKDQGTALRGRTVCLGSNSCSQPPPGTGFRQFPSRLHVPCKPAARPWALGVRASDFLSRLPAAARMEHKAAATQHAEFRLDVESLGRGPGTGIPLGHPSGGPRGRLAPQS